MYKNLKLKQRPSKSAVSNMFRPKDLARIKSFKDQTNPHLLQQKSSKQSHYPELEEKLFAWFRKIEMQHGVLTDDILRMKALDIATKMGLTFQASANWVLRFKKRHGIDQKVRHGEGGSADHIYVAIAHAGIPKLLRNYNVNPYDTYNMDETGLNYRTLPKASLGTASGKGHVAAKDRLTAVMCVNATGTHKLKPMI